MTERGAADPPPEQGASFHQRLRERYGPNVARIDPGIELQGPDVGTSDAATASSETKPDSGTTRALFKKLTHVTATSVRYRLGEEVGRGGMGTVVRVWDQDLRRTLAMKVLTATPSPDGPIADKDEERLSRFLEEAQITGQLDHPGIVPVHDMGIGEDGRLYFTMRLVRGRELKEVLDLARENKDGWTLTRAIGLILKVCEAMAFAHSKGVVHRDLKPSNVMVGRFGEVYVMDWGLARVLGRRDEHERDRVRPAAADPSSLSIVRTVRRDEQALDPESPLITLDGDVVGTPSYMALEQAEGKLSQLGARSDVYSLGAVLYFMLTGRAPYVEPGERISPHVVLQRVLQAPPAPVSKYAKQAPAELVAVCEKAMAREARHRYGSMLDVAEDLQAYLEGRVVRAYEGGAWAEFRKWTTRNRGMAAALTGIICLVLASIVGFALQKDQQVQELSIQQSITDAAREQAENHADRARANAAEAQANLELAREREAEADRNARIAAANFEESRRSSYIANVSAAKYSLQLNQAGRARRYLEQAEPELRGWEWGHLALRADGARSHIELSANLIDALQVAPDSSMVHLFTSSGRLLSVEVGGELTASRVIDPKRLVPTFAGNAVARTQALAPGGLELAVSSGDTLDFFRLDPFGTAVGERQVIEWPASRAGRAPGVASYSPDGRSLALAFDNGAVTIFERHDGHMLDIEPLGGRIEQLRWSPDGTRLLALLSKGALHEVDAATGASSLIELPRDLAPGELRTRVAWVGDGSRFVTGDSTGAIELWQLDGALVGTFDDHAARISAIAAQGDSVATASEDGVVRLHQLSDRRSRVLRGHEKGVSHLCFLPNGEGLLSVDTGGNLRRWDDYGDGATSMFQADLERASDAALLADGKRVVVGGSDGFLGLYELETGARLRVYRGHEETSNVTSVALDADGSTLLSGGSDKTARLWDVETGDLIAIFRGHSKLVSSVVLSADGTRAYTGSSDETVRQWNCRTGEELAVLEAGDSRVYELALSHDGRYLAAAGREVFVWELASGAEFCRFDGHGRSRTRAVAFSRDGERLASSSSSGELALWNLRAVSEEPIRIDDHYGDLRSLHFAADGKRLLSVGQDGEVDVRDARSGDLILQLGPWEHGLMSAEFSLDGETVAAIDSHGTVRAWFTGDRGRRLDRVHEAVREQGRVALVVEEALLASERVEDLPRFVQERSDLEQALRARALVEAEWVVGLPDWIDAVHRRLLVSRNYDEAGLRRLLARCIGCAERWRHRPEFELTKSAALLRAGEHSEAERALVDVMGPGASESRRLTGSALQEGNLLLVLALDAQGRSDEALAIWTELEDELTADATLDREGWVEDLTREVAASLADDLGV
ncbi:MAG: protein kinase [Planctomycetota bacterium]